MTLDQAIRRAKEKSSGNTRHYFVIECDHEDDRTYAVVTEGYLDSEDFEAFNSKALLEFYDGEEC